MAALPKSQSRISLTEEVLRADDVDAHSGDDPNMRPLWRGRGSLRWGLTHHESTDEVRRPNAPRNACTRSTRVLAAISLPRARLTPPCVPSAPVHR